MATREALAIRREAAFARIAAAAGAQPPAANRYPDVTLTEFVEWTADQLEAKSAGKPAKASKAKATDDDKADA